MDTPDVAEAKGSRARTRKLRDDVLSRKVALFLVGPLATLLVALVLVFFVFFDTSTIIGPSMLPTLHDYDYVLLTKGLAEPHRGDIVIVNVVFKGAPQEWVKRVVALGGDVVDFVGDSITINGIPDQTVFPHLITASGDTRPLGHLTVPSGEVFLAGDNRGVSEDSRYVGTFPLSAIRGRVVFLYAPIWRVGPVPAPAR